MIRIAIVDDHEMVREGLKAILAAEPDFEIVKRGYFEARAVKRHIKGPEDKWSAVEGSDEKGLPKSGVPLLHLPILYPSLTYVGQSFFFIHRFRVSGCIRRAAAASSDSETAVL